MEEEEQTGVGTKLSLHGTHGTELSDRICAAGDWQCHVEPGLLRFSQTGCVYFHTFVPSVVFTRDTTSSYLATPCDALFQTYFQATSSREITLLLSSKIHTITI
jgi:hypothetical protein